MIEPHQKPSHADSPADALAISMQEVGRVELDYMKALTGQTEEDSCLFEDNRRKILTTLVPNMT